VDVLALRAERAAIKETLQRYARDEVLGKRTPEQVTAATLVGTQRIAEIDQWLHANVTDDPLADLVNATDPVQAWQDTPLANKRLIIDRLMTVTILPMGRAGRGFDRSSVRIEALCGSPHKASNRPNACGAVASGRPPSPSRAKCRCNVRAEGAHP